MWPNLDRSWFNYSSISAKNSFETMDGGFVKSDKRWWKEVVIYQIYPSSFKDTNGDGVGNINGITDKLDYLKELGVDVVWLSPIYKSPQFDMGYDISDYCDIYPPFGTLEDVDRLIAELQSRDMKLVMDLVVNHTSSEHPWFLDSVQSKTSEHRDWYIWKKPQYDAYGVQQPPNNWAGLLDDSRSAWTYHPVTDEYYLSLFSEFQPDLNWENPRVRGEVHNICKFWLDRGASGFRMDVINLICKDQRFLDADVVRPDKRFQPGDKYFANGPRLKEYLKELKDKVLSKYDTITVGEMPFLEDDEQRLEFVKAEDGCLNMIFTFERMGLDMVPEEGRFSYRRWTVDELKTIVAKLQSIHTKQGWAAVFVENHDQPRAVTRFTDDSDAHRVAGCKLLCMAQITRTGTLYIYQGQELGMRNVPAHWGPEEYKDIESIAYWRQVSSKYPEGSLQRRKAMDLLRLKARDNSRTPFQWDSTSNGGFCPPGVKPWMRVNDDYTVVNAAAQTAAGKANERSAIVTPFRFYQRALEIRKKHANLFIYGVFKLVDNTHPSVFAFTKTSGSDVAITVLNFSGKGAEFTIPAGCEVQSWVLGSLDSITTEKPKEGTVQLLPWEGMVGLCKGN